MWPVMTLTLLLQLTDEEQLYATIEPQPAAIEADQPAAEPVPAIEVLVAAEDGMA
jgi:hypothetical protein